MRVTSDPDVLLGRVAEAFDQAAADVVDEARRRARRHSRSGKFADSIQTTETRWDGTSLTARVGSPLSSAKAKELGAFIQSKRSPDGKMRFRLDTGQWVTLEAFRIAARPSVGPAVRMFADFMKLRLGTGAGSSGTATFRGRADSRSGRVDLPG